MPPKQQRVVVERADRRRAAPKGVVGKTYDALTSPDNASVVRSVAIFGLAVAFFSSSWSDVLLPAF